LFLGVLGKAQLDLQDASALLEMAVPALVLKPSRLPDASRALSSSFRPNRVPGDPSQGLAEIIPRAGTYC